VADVVRAAEPILVLAPPRSCSTVTVALLAGHPRVYGFPETSLFTAESVSELMDRPRGPTDMGTFQLNGLLRAVAQLHEGAQQAAQIERARQWLGKRAHWTTKRLMDYLLGVVGPMIGLEKSPGTVGTQDSLQRCLRAYPRARYIHLTRHPVNFQRSMTRCWGFPGSPVESAPTPCAVRWYATHLRITQALHQLPAAQWIRIRAEDLLNDPHRWLPEILTWLDLSAEEHIVERMLRTERWDFARCDSPALGGGDPGFMQNPALRTATIPEIGRTDPGWDLTPQGLRRISALAAYFGY
jgi:Sulfotransferase family